MVTIKNNVWSSSTARQLAQTLAAIGAVDDMQNFLRDVMTEKEILEMSARFEAARMLRAGKKYTEIVSATKLSSRTVARISQWLQNGCNGYEAALRIANHHSHILPAHAD